MNQFGLSLLFKVTEIAKSVYYYWIKRFKKPKKDIDIVKSIKQICKESDYTYGYRRVTQALVNKGITVNHKKVRRIMKEHQLTCKKFNHKTRKYNSYRGTIGKVARNILKRRFNTDRPYQKVVTDITEFKLLDGTKAYLSPFMDLYSLEILSYRISKRPTIDIVIEPLNELLTMRPQLFYRMTIHSDQGWHYQNRNYIESLKEHDVFQSMSRKGNCLDNASMENFFGLLKQEMYYGKSFETFQELEQSIHKYISFYNNTRIKAKLKGLSPKQYRKQTFKIVY